MLPAQSRDYTPAMRLKTPKTPERLAWEIEKKAAARAEAK